MKAKILALGNDHITTWVSDALIPQGIEVIRLFEVPETITILKQDNYNLAIVDGSMADVENVCFRLIWLCRLRVIVLSEYPQSDLDNLKDLGVEDSLPFSPDQAAFTTNIEAVICKGNYTFGHIKVLIIEDDRHIREAISLCFKIFWPEAEVYFADEGQNGVNFAKNHNLDLILLDLGLPDISGFEALSWIRNFSRTPVIILTASREKETVVRAIQSGANDYIVKPFKQIELMPRIRKYIK